VNGSFEDGQVVIRMSKAEADRLTCELFYTIDYRPEENPEYAALESALHKALDGSWGA
jgi:hypothetical protein